MLSATRRKTILLTATGLAVAMAYSPAIAQQASVNQPAVTNLTGVEGDTTVSTVVVKGLRKSLESAANKKRRSAQISDSIIAEDVGKLPDNNVAEALAHVPGIQISRERGEGGSVLIRGQSDIQTTINGNASNSGVGRSQSLNDIPAELLKSVTVYKTRTADQVEGGIAGSVNVDLRRPLDLPKGPTFAGSLRQVYGSVGDTKSPYGSALIANRFDTAWGEMGLLLNASYQKNNYNEQFVESETPALFWGAQQTSLPADRRLNTYSVYRARYGLESGTVKRPALNASYQWRINKNLDIVLEGSMFNSKETRRSDALEVRVKDSPANPSNIVYQPDGKMVKSMTLMDPNPADTDLIPAGPRGRDDVIDSKNKRINFETHWNSEKHTANFGIYRDTNKLDLQWYNQLLRLKGLTGVNVDLNSPKVPTGGPYFEFIGADVGNADIYTMNEIENGKSFENSEEMVASADYSYRFSETALLRRAQVGVRFSDRDAARAYGYRWARFTGANTVALKSFPGGANPEAVRVDVPGFDSPTWYRLSNQDFVNSFDAIRAYAVAKASATGGSGSWADPVVSSERLTSTFESNEKTSAIFGQLFLGGNLGPFPVAGIIGVRVVKTSGESSTGNFNATTGTTTTVKRSGKGTDTMPSVSGVIHWTDKLQLRLAYTVNIQRPNFQDASSFVFYDTSNKTGWGGNPELRPNEETAYDASLEYYFGRGGIVSLATYLKKPDGFVAWGDDQVLYDEDNNPATPNVSYRINRPQNQGPGEYQGYEFNVQGFFDFLPAPWNNVGAQFNATYNRKGTIKYRYLVEDASLGDFPGKYDAPFNSKLTYNMALYYETPKYSARVAYNFRDAYRYDRDYASPEYSRWNEPTSRLDAAFNYTPIRQLTLSLEGTNLLEDESKVNYGKENLLPQGVRVPARTVQLSARFRY
jgi:iron complex outermembrane receptor protein